jgi:hypothetical protein
MLKGHRRYTVLATEELDFELFILWADEMLLVMSSNNL